MARTVWMSLVFVTLVGCLPTGATVDTEPLSIRAVEPVLDTGARDEVNDLLWRYALEGERQEESNI